MQRRLFLKSVGALVAGIATMKITESVAVEQFGAISWESIDLPRPSYYAPRREIKVKDGVTYVQVGGHNPHYDTLEQFDTWVKFNTWSLLNLTVAAGGPYMQNVSLQQLVDEYAGLDNKTQLTVELYSEMVSPVLTGCKTDERHSITLRSARELVHPVTVKKSNEVPLLKKPMWYNVRNAYLPRVIDAT